MKSRNHDEHMAAVRRLSRVSALKSFRRDTKQMIARRKQRDQEWARIIAEEPAGCTITVIGEARV